MPKPGWQPETVKGKHDKFYLYYHGRQLTECVKEIVWSGGKLTNERYDEFVFSGFLAGDPNSGLFYIPVTQECEKDEARWTDIPAPGAPALIILAQHSQPGGGQPDGRQRLQSRIADHRGAMGACNAGRRENLWAAS